MKSTCAERPRVVEYRARRIVEYLNSTFIAGIEQNRSVRGGANQSTQGNASGIVQRVWRRRSDRRRLERAIGGRRVGSEGEEVKVATTDINGMVSLTPTHTRTALRTEGTFYLFT